MSWLLSVLLTIDYVCIAGNIKYQIANNSLEVIIALANRDDQETRRFAVKALANLTVLGEISFSLSACWKCTALLSFSGGGDTQNPTHRGRVPSKDSCSYVLRWPNHNHQHSSSRVIPVLSGESF